LESLVDTLGRAMPVQTTWSVFYLKAADATETAAMLEQLFPTSSVSLTNSAADTGLMGSLTGGISSLGRSVAGMTGLSSLGGGMQTLRIIPEVRANALFVSGPPLLVRQVGDTLKILDAAELPESFRDRVPRFIPVRYADVNEVATIVKEVYKDYMEDANSAGGRDDRRMRAFAAMMGGGGGNQGNQQRQQPAIRLTLGVDLQTSQLIVSSSEAIYQQVASLVETLDQSAEDARRTVRVIPLENSESVMVQQALGQLIPKVRISGTIRQNTSTTTSTSSTGNRSGSTSSDEERRERFRQFFQQRMQQGGGGGDRGRATSGGNRSRSTGSTRGGGSSRGGFGGGGGRSGGGRGSRGRN
ncbi:MAG: hypothetical protein KDA79_18130, partial [Planctomycetaceae bacterium]|nr:hypothetical protein [Planctomycetaceae bacterium]